MKSVLLTLALIVGFTTGLNSLVGSTIESAKAQQGVRHQQIEQQVALAQR